MKTEKFRILCTNGESFPIELPPPASNESFFAFSLPKAGSVLLDNILSDYCLKELIPVIAPNKIAWSHGVQPALISKDVERLFRVKGYAYLGFRHYLTFNPDFNMERVKKILLIRDPRDMLTSLYYSVKYSHPVPQKQGSASKTILEKREQAKNKDIDDFVKDNVEFYVGQFERYKRELLSLPNTKVYRYEDIIFDKENWLRSMIEFLGGELPDDIIKKIADKHDIIPAEENPQSHIRQVAPGNYKKHLSENTINYLNSSLADILKRFKYEEVNIP